MNRNYIVIYSTFPNLRCAKRIISGLVKERLAACGNIFKLFSIYRWQHRIEKTAEYGALIKTRNANYAAAQKYIIEKHPYEVPEIISWPIDKGLEKYLDWINDESS
jgi:periplasmic divalent cation tolerance protein